jgi:nicotinamide phosphoribosyltransferase
MPNIDPGVAMNPTGVLAVKRVRGVPTVFPADSGDVAPGEDLLQMIYDHGPVQGMVWDDFDTLRARVAREWDALPKNADNISAPLRAKVAALRTDTHGLRGGGGEGGGSAAAATVAAAAANGSTP